MLWERKVELSVLVTPKRIEKSHWLPRTGVRVGARACSPFAGRSSRPSVEHLVLRCWRARCLRMGRPLRGRGLLAGSDQHFANRC